MAAIRARAARAARSSCSCSIATGGCERRARRSAGQPRLQRRCDLAQRQPIGDVVVRTRPRRSRSRACDRWRYRGSRSDRRRARPAAATGRATHRPRPRSEATIAARGGRQATHQPRAGRRRGRSRRRPPPGRGGAGSQAAARRAARCTPSRAAAVAGAGNGASAGVDMSASTCCARSCSAGSIGEPAWIEATSRARSLAADSTPSRSSPADMPPPPGRTALAAHPCVGRGRRPARADARSGHHLR